MIKSRPFRDEDGRLHRMLLAHVRQEFEAPVGAILGYTEIMLKDAEERQDIIPFLATFGGSIRLD